VNQLKIYKENGKFIIEQINQFNHSFKKKYVTEDGLLEGVEPYKKVIDEYNLEVQQGIDLLPKVFHVLFA